MQMLNYNVPHGKLNRGMAVVDAARAMAPDGELPPEQTHKARVLGWCIEFVRRPFRYSYSIDYQHILVLLQSIITTPI